jgi:hypothetical protein
LIKGDNLKQPIASPGGDIVKEYLRKYPEYSSNRLAKLIFLKCPGVYASQDVVRMRIRYYRGSAGKKNRDVLMPENFIPKINIPESEPEPFGFFNLGYEDFPGIFGGDAHIPYHDQDALEMFIERAISMKAKTVGLMGDFIDMYQVSRFSRDPRMRSVKDEIEMLKSILVTIRKACPKSRIIYKFGNHEERYDDYMMRAAPELFGIPEIHLESLIDLKENNIELIKNKNVIKAGHLFLLHGHEYVYSISNPVNPARGLYNRAKKSAICWHHHQTSDHTEPSIDGDVIGDWSSGCLCGLHPQYMPLNKWNLGFTEIEMDENSFSVNNRKIINYRIV